LRLEPPAKARVVQDYHASDPDPLVITAGEELRVGKNDSRWPAFVRCTNRAGKAGWVPEIFIVRRGESGVARDDYSAVELTVSAGDQLTVAHEVGGWYWVTGQNGRSGWVPVEHVETL
jgi:hypothetical protein